MKKSASFLRNCASGSRAGIRSATAEKTANPATDASRAADNQVAAGRQHEPPRLVTYDRTESSQTAERIGNAEIAITNKVRIGADVIAACPTLKLIAVAATPGATLGIIGDGVLGKAAAKIVDEEALVRAVKAGRFPALDLTS